MFTKPTLFIPGFGGSHRDFDHFTNHFSKGSVVKFTTEVSLEDHLKTIKDSLDMSGDQVVLVGISWGAILALHAAEKYEEQVEALVLAGAGRSLKMPRSLTTIMKFPFVGFVFLVLMFFASYPLYRIFDKRGYKQKYGGVGVLQRLGWRQTHKVFNQTLLKTTYMGNLAHDTLFLNLTSDDLVNLNEVHDLIESNVGNNLIESKLFDLSDQHHIHFTHELDELLLDEATLFLNNQNSKNKRSIEKYVNKY